MQRIKSIRRQAEQNHKFMVSIITSLMMFVLLPLASCLFRAPDCQWSYTTLATFGLYVALAFNTVAIPVACFIHWNETH